MNNHTLKIRKNDFDEYEVQYLINGIKNEDRTYYTDDLDDAKATLILMQKEINTVCDDCQNPSHINLHGEPIHWTFRGHNGKIIGDGYLCELCVDIKIDKGIRVV